MIAGAMSWRQGPAFGPAALADGVGDPQSRVSAFGRLCCSAVDRGSRLHGVFDESLVVEAEQVSSRSKHDVRCRCGSVVGDQARRHAARRFYP